MGCSAGDSLIKNVNNAPDTSMRTVGLQVKCGPQHQLCKEKELCSPNFYNDCIFIDLKALQRIIDN